MLGAIPLDIFIDIMKQDGVYHQLNLDLDTPPEFELPWDYFSDIQVGYKQISCNSNSEHSLQTTEYHPGFKNLRNYLHNNSYIEAVFHQHNTDKVLKRFRLNKVWMEPGDTFSSPSALKNILQRKLGIKNEVIFR